MMKKATQFLMGTLCFVLLGTMTAFGQVTFDGNGNGGFGGPLGQGDIEITDDGTNISFTFTKGTGGDFNDALVIYVDSKTGGFANTSTLTDQGDYLRQASSGYNDNTRALVNFPSGFEADFSIAVHVKDFDYAGTFELVGSGSHTAVGSANLVGTPSVSDASFEFSVSKSDIGISGDIDFTFVATYLNPGSSSAPFRSDEAIGQGISSGNPGTTAVSYTSYFEYSSGDEFDKFVTIFGSEGWRILSTPTSDNSYDDLLGDLWTRGLQSAQM